MASNNVYDCIIIGGGLSGLTAALYLKDSNVKNICVLEARDRIGGRACTETVTLDDGRVSRHSSGPSFIGPLQNRIVRTAARYGINVYPVYLNGYVAQNNNGKVSKIHDVPNLSVLTILDLNYVNQRIEELVPSIDLANIWNSKLSKEDIIKYDQMSLREWVESTIANQEAIEIFVRFTSDLCAHAAELSFLGCLKLFASAGGPNRATHETNGADSFYIDCEGGANTICQQMENELNEMKADTVKLSKIVTLIRYSNDDKSVEVVTENGETFRSRYLIVTIPPGIYKTITWEPALSWQREALTSSLTFGTVIKIHTYFKTPFWRENGYSGKTFTTTAEDDDLNLISQSMDGCRTLLKDASYGSGKINKIGNSPEDPKSVEFAALIGFVTGDKAKNVCNDYDYSQRKKMVLDQYYKLFGNDDRVYSECIGYFEKIWHEEKFSYGGYASFYKINALSQRCADGIVNLNDISQAHKDRNLSQIKNRLINNGKNGFDYDLSKIKYSQCSSEGKCIYFAGAELSTTWQCAMDGAVQTGERAANQVCNLLIDDGIANEKDMKPLFGEGFEPDEFAFMGDKKLIEKYGIEVEDVSPSFVERMLPSSQTVVTSVAAIGAAAGVGALAWYHSKYDLNKLWDQIKNSINANTN